MMSSYWIMYAVAALICIICVVASTPNAWADKFLAKFDTHPKINGDSNVFINGSQLAEKDKQQFIGDFNNAEFRYTYNLTHSMPTYDGTGVRVAAKMTRKVVNFILYPYDDHIDVVKEMGNKVTQYRLDSINIQKHLLSSKQDTHYVSSRGTIKETSTN